MAAKAALALVLMLCCASAALATYDYKPQCTCDEDCGGHKNQCKVYKCQHGKCVSYNKNDGCSCNDGQKCTYDDKCYYGVCKGKPVKCSTKEPCKYAYCNPHTGSCDTKCKPDGSGCNDGNKCTSYDSCWNGVCKGKWKNCPNKSPCTKTYCNPITGQCTSKPTNEGGYCSDGDHCTVHDKCCNGVCKGTPKTCPNNNVCVKTYCNPLDGTCKYKPTNEGGKCDDGNPKTCDDKCCNGVCKGTYKPPKYDPPAYDPPAKDPYPSDEPTFKPTSEDDKYHG